MRFSLSAGKFETFYPSYMKVDNMSRLMLEQTKYKEVTK